jgi:SAM-dependent methyltransferase
LNPKNKASYKFRKAWSWPFEVEAKIKELCEGYTLHVCSGESTIGDVRIDVEKLADVKASMFWLPIRQESFDTVLCDPPWELQYNLRGRLLRQLRDCLKPGGRLIFNCFWFPKTRGLAVDPEIYVGVPHSVWRNASLLITARRMAIAGAVYDQDDKPLSRFSHFARIARTRRQERAASGSQTSLKSIPSRLETRSEGKTVA